MAKRKTDQLKAAVYLLAAEYQQQFYEISSDWNRYNNKEHLYLKNYIGYALYGPPEYEEVSSDAEDGIYVYEDKRSMQLIDAIYKKVVEHGTQLRSNKAVLCSVVYSCLYDEGSLKSCDIKKLHELVYLRPIFKVQKCVERNGNVELRSWYIDTEARVYKNWKDFLSNNNMPACTMIAPKDGMYQANLRELWCENTSTVWLETHNNNSSVNIMTAVDVTSTLVNVGCAAVGIAAIFNPISAPIAIAGVVGGVVSGAWGGGRAIGELVDRGTHEQSINVTDKRALSAWVGVAGNTLGIAATGGTALLTRAVRTGTTIAKGAQIAHDAVSISNLVVNSIGIGCRSYNIIEKCKETGEISSKDVFFLTTHILFFCNSVVRMKFASEIIKTEQNQILKNYEDSLRCTRHQQEFRRLVSNTGKNVTDEVSRNEQIIRSLNKISNKDEFFAAIVQNSETFQSLGTQLSFAEGQVQINDVTLISASSFASMSKESIVNLARQASGSNLTSSAQASAKIGLSGNSFISDNTLKAGISTLRNFYVQKSVTSSIPIEARAAKYEGIIGDLQNVIENSQILKYLLDTGLCIVRKISNNMYDVDDMLADATNFIWQVIKINFARSLPGINMLENSCLNFLRRLVKATYEYVKSNRDEWVKAFRNHMKLFSSHSKDNTDSPCTQKSSVSKYLGEYSQVLYNNTVMLDPVVVMALPKEVLAMLFQESLSANSSKIKSKNTPSQKVINLYKEELNVFFSKNPVSLGFSITSLLRELNDMIIDLENFDKGNIIFYKLLIISINIAQKIADASVLRKDLLIDILNYLWIFVNMNFSQILESTCIFKEEGLVISIIIAIYWYQINEPDKWLNAFYMYRRKCAKQ